MKNWYICNIPPACKTQSHHLSASTSGLNSSDMMKGFKPSELAAPEVRFRSTLYLCPSWNIITICDGEAPWTWGKLQNTTSGQMTNVFQNRVQKNSCLICLFSVLIRSSAMLCPFYLAPVHRRSKGSLSHPSLCLPFWYRPASLLFGTRKTSWLWYQAGAGPQPCLPQQRWSRSRRQTWESAMPQLPQQPQASLALACGRITLGMALADDFARIRLATSLVSVTLHTLPISTFKLPRSVMKQSFRVNTETWVKIDSVKGYRTSN